MPASPPNADTSKATPRPWYIAQQSATECLIYGGHSVNSFARVYCNGYEGKKACHDAALIVEAVNAYDALRAAACKDPTLHAVADAPLRPLSDLLRAATEFDEIADELNPPYGYLPGVAGERITALRAAVRALQGPPAPFRPQQAHAAPANGGAA